MQDVVAQLDSIAYELRRADRKTAASSRETITRLFEDILITMSDPDHLAQAQGAHVLCSLYLSDLAERSRPSGLNVALASVQRLRVELGRR
jgi:site-specific recombinase